MEQRFGAYRVSPNARVPHSGRAPPLVFNTDHQEVFRLVGYGVIVPRVFSEFKVCLLERPTYAMALWSHP